QLALGALVFAYNLYYFRELLGGYSAGLHTMGYGEVNGVFHNNLAEAIAGNLVSPSRGIFLFVPWTLLALWGAARTWRKWPWAPAMLMGAFAHFLMYSKIERWWAGWSYGPRYFTDIMPILVWCLVPLLDEFPRRRWLQPALVTTVALAFFVHTIGAYCYPNGEWNSKPTNIDHVPQRVWDWRDPQILRTLKAGPAPLQFVEVRRLKTQQ